jgi:hypothetical protein
MSTETLNGHTLFFADTEGPTLSSEADALDLLAETHGTETDMIVVPVQRLAPEFFDLSTRLAGGFFQKMQNYRMRLAILGDISADIEASKSLRDFVTETNRTGHHMFVPDLIALTDRLGEN